MTETAALTSVVVAVLMLAIGLGFGVYHSITKTRRGRQSIEALLNASRCEVPKPGAIVTVNWENHAYCYQFLNASRNQPPEFRLWYVHSNVGQARIRAENKWDRLCKQFGIVSEVQTKDRKFDAHYFIDSAEVGFAQALFAKPEARDAIKTIMASGFTEVVFDENAIMAKRRQPTSVARNAPTLRDAAKCLLTLASDQPVVRSEHGQLLRQRWRRLLIGVYSSLAVAVCAALALFILGSKQFRPIDMADAFYASLAYSTPTLLVAICLLLAILRGRSSSHLHLGVSALIAVCAAPLLGFGTLMLANAYGDTSALQTHRSAVIDKRATQSKSQTTYRAEVRSWRAGKTTEELIVSRTLYHSLVVDRDHLDVFTRAGKLGYAWLAAQPRISVE